MHRKPQTPVIVGRSVGRPGESVTVTDLARLMADTIDMTTVVVIGSSTTRVIDRPSGASVYTPRSYGLADTTAQGASRR
jgi:cobalt-precorrin 5A hydrolase / precorrin-3B C17-methyltransferase